MAGTRTKAVLVVSPPSNNLLRDACPAQPLKAFMHLVKTWDYLAQVCFNSCCFSYILCCAGRGFSAVMYCNLIVLFPVRHLGLTCGQERWDINLEINIMCKVGMKIVVKIIK